MRVSGVAYVRGGIPAYGGDASSRPEGIVMPGGVDYVEDDGKCQEHKSDGTRCEAYAVGGGTLCIGHRNRAEKLAREQGDG